MYSLSEEEEQINQHKIAPIFETKAKISYFCIIMYFVFIELLNVRRRYLNKSWETPDKRTNKLIKTVQIDLKTYKSNVRLFLTY